MLLFRFIAQRRFFCVPSVVADLLMMLLFRFTAQMTDYNELLRVWATGFYQVSAIVHFLGGVRRDSIALRVNLTFVYKFGSFRLFCWG